MKLIKNTLLWVIMLSVLILSACAGSDAPALADAANEFTGVSATEATAPTTATTAAPTTPPATESTAPPATESTAPPAESSGQDYTLNNNTMKFHYPTCGSAGKIKEENKASFHGTRDELIAQGYSPCGNCHP